MTNRKVYISGALMGAQDLNKVKELYNHVAKICTDNNLYPYLPHNNTDPVINIEFSDYDVYKKDIVELAKSFLIISYIGEPSLGVGAELSISISNKIPIIAIVENNKRVSRFLKGMLKSNETTLIEFEDKEDLFSKLDVVLKAFI